MLLPKLLKFLYRIEKHNRFSFNTQISRFKKNESFKTNQTITKEEYYLFFKDRVPHIDKQIAAIIQEIGKDSHNINRINELFKKYLDIPFQKQKRTLQEVLNLVYAISVCGIDSLAKYQPTLISQVSRLNVEQVQLSKETLNIFIILQADYRKSEKVKHKNIRMLFNVMTLVQNNFDKVEPEQYYFILYNLCVQMKYQSNFRKIAHHLQTQTNRIMTDVIDGKWNKHEKILSDRFINQLNESYKIYGCQTVQNMQIYFGFITKVYMVRHFDTKDTFYSCINYIYRNFNYQIKNKDGVYFKQLLFKEITKQFTTSDSIKNFAARKHGAYLCSSIITNQFYQYAQKFQFNELGSFKYLPKTALINKPQLPNIFWQIYKFNPQSLNYISYIQSIIRDVYPEKYIFKSGERITNIQPNLQTQMRIRVEQALVNLKLKFQSQIQISGRFIDFLIQDNIILEVDGLPHFTINTLQITDKTQTRNVHLLLKGYRLVILNIYEYNIVRQVEQLQQLLSAKIELLKSKDAVLVI